MLYRQFELKLFHLRFVKYGPLQGPHSREGVASSPVSKIVERPTLPVRYDDEPPIHHFRGNLGLERHMEKYHKGSKIRIFDGKHGTSFYTAKEVGERRNLCSHFEDNIEIHTLQSCATYVNSIYRCHDFYNEGERAYKQRQYALKNKYSESILTHVLSIIFIFIISNGKVLRN